jgi:hypothetical protein
MIEKIHQAVFDIILYNLFIFFKEIAVDVCHKKYLENNMT